MPAKKTSNYSKVEVPEYLELTHTCNDPRFFIACYYITFFFRFPFDKFLSFDELKKIADDQRNKTPASDRFPYDAFHERFFFIIKKNDPTLFCGIIIIPSLSISWFYAGVPLKRYWKIADWHLQWWRKYVSTVGIQSSILLMSTNQILESILNTTLTRSRRSNNLVHIRNLWNALKAKS